MSNDNKDQNLDNDNLHDDRTPDIQQGESKPLSGGRRLTKFPLIVLGCVIFFVLIITAYAMMNASNKNEVATFYSEVQPHGRVLK